MSMQQFLDLEGSIGDACDDDGVGILGWGT